MESMRPASPFKTARRRQSRNAQLREAAAIYARMQRVIPLHLIRCAVWARDNGGSIVLAADSKHGEQHVRLTRAGEVVIQELGARDGSQSIAEPTITFPSPFNS